jgi:hypothetical protein
VCLTYNLHLVYFDYLVVSIDLFKHVTYR